MKTVTDLEIIRETTLKKIKLAQDSNQVRVVVGLGTCGIASGAKDVFDKFLEMKDKLNLDNVDVVQTGCIGVCMYEPMAEVYVNNLEKVTYIELTPEIVEEIVYSHLVNNKVLSEYTIGKYYHESEGN